MPLCLSYDRTIQLSAIGNNYMAAAWNKSLIWPGFEHITACVRVKFATTKINHDGYTDNDFRYLMMILIRYDTSSYKIELLT